MQILFKNFRKTNLTNFVQNRSRNSKKLWFVCQTDFALIFSHSHKLGPFDYFYHSLSNEETFDRQKNSYFWVSQTILNKMSEDGFSKIFEKKIARVHARCPCPKRFFEKLQDLNNPYLLKEKETLNFMLRRRVKISFEWPRDTEYCTMDRKWDWMGIQRTVIGRAQAFSFELT